jgi:hypothetical protein
MSPQEDSLMRISLADSCANGFNKWCDMHDSGQEDDGRGGAYGTIIIADQDPDQAVVTPPKWPHRPSLVPGVGTLSNADQGALSLTCSTIQARK